MATPTLYLLDGMALVYRAHFAFINRPFINSKGVNTSALFGFTSTLAELLDNRNPTHLAVAMDTEAPTQRHRDFADYKATRQAMPEDLSEALPHVQRLLEAYNIPLLALDGYEADDIIATLAVRAAQQGFEVFMVTPDKDFGQLVSDRIFIYKPGYKGEAAEIFGVPEVLARWGISRPEQVVDMLALCGDSSDNIPGVPGIGEKTAAKLLAEFGTVENLLANTDRLKGKQKERIEAAKDDALLSKRLARIITDVPIDVPSAALLRRDPDKQLLADMFAEFEFRTLTRRILGGSTRDTPAQPSTPGDAFQEELIPAEHLGTIRTTPHEYLTITEASARDQLLRRLLAADAFAFDLETAGTDPHADRPLGIAFATAPGHAAWVPLPYDLVDAHKVLREFQPAFTTPNSIKIAHNLKFDLSVLQAAGLQIQAPIFDTMLAHALVDPDGRHGLDHLARTLLHYDPVPFDQVAGSSGLESANPAAVAEYAAEDADVAFRLFQILRGKLTAMQQERVFYEIEMPLVPVLASMEAAGVHLDVPALNRLERELDEAIAAAEKDIWRMAGREFQISSPKQLGQVLFDELKLIEKPKKTATGQYATNEQVLQSLAPRHEIVSRLLDYREVLKLKNTYAAKLPSAVSPRTGRVHTVLGQLQTATGRLVSDNPNLQNIPVRTELGREVRRAFIARDDNHVLLSADYSQIELRIIAALSGDANFRAAFASREDIHTATAAHIYRVNAADVTREMRSKAKMVNFGIPYGITPFGLAQRLGAGRAEAAELIDSYFNRFPGVRDYIETTLAFARQNGYVETLTGRRRYLRDIGSQNMTTRMAAERNAINMPIQGTAADMIKLAMSRIHRVLQERGLHSQLLLQVHDELLFEAPKAELDTLQPLVEDAMKHALPLDGVPIEIEMGHGHSWLDAH